MIIAKIGGKWVEKDDYWGGDAPHAKFYIDDFPGQCGAMVLADWSFHNISTERIKVEAEDMMKTILRRMEGDCGKLVASAVVNSALDIWLQSVPGWQYGTVVVNPNTGHRIRLYEYDV